MHVAHNCDALHTGNAKSAASLYVLCAKCCHPICIIIAYSDCQQCCYRCNVLRIASICDVLHIATAQSAPSLKLVANAV